MKLGSLIKKEFILVGESCQSVYDALDKLIVLFDRKKKLPVSIEQTRKIIKEREQLGGTLLSPGIAFPHGRIEGFQDLLIGVWIPDSPIETPEGSVRVLFLALTSKSGTALYLPVLAALGKFFQNPASLDSVTSAKSKQEVWKILDGITLRREITVEDIMTREPFVCRRETTLAELIDLFRFKNLSYIPVVDDKNIQIGEVTVKDLLSRGIPDYVRRLESIKFLKTLDPFEALHNEEDNVLVGEIMRKPSRYIAPDAPIIEAAVMITGKGFRHLPVLDHGYVVGLVSETDILKKIIRG